MLRSTLTMLVLVASGASSAAGPTFSGNYVVPSTYGGMVLALEQSPGGAVTGTLVTTNGDTCRVSGQAAPDEDGEWSVEGLITCANGRSDFEFSEDEGDEFLLLVVPYDETGTPRSDRAAVFYAQRPGPADPSTGSARAPDPPVAGRDPALVGVWATQVVTSTPGGSMATQLLMEIRADGTLVDLGSRSVGGIPGVGGDTGLQGGGDVAAWQTEGNVLQVSYGGSAWVPLARYDVSGNRVLLVYYDGDRKVWYRR